MKPRCTVDGCDRPHKGRGLCDMHIQRLRRTGTTASPVKTLAERFWAKVDRRGPDECWEWLAATKDGGYGVMRPSGKRTGPPLKAHRVSAQLAGMDIEDRAVLHSCDNPPCVNPAHLRPGTLAENSADAVDRDRIAFGERCHLARLTTDAVAIIKRDLALGVSRRSLAERSNVHPGTVTAIANGHTWARVMPARLGDAA